MSGTWAARPRFPVLAWPLRLLFLFGFLTGHALAADPESGIVSTKITSDSMIHDPDAGKLLFSGNVEVVHPDFHLTSDRLQVFLSGGSGAAKGLDGADAGVVQKIVAESRVKIRLPEGRTASCAKLAYSVATEVLQMDGSPMLREGGNQIRGDQMFFYLRENRNEVRGRVEMDIVSPESSSGGRRAGALGELLPKK
ncbi:MAG: hypothetical protein LBD82_08265 [Deltaproteobacteria bacterium]|jgi:lipopolysaccharide transport protein LptA|nr:hypothetical protein [Deltaproteobacteria bacterium]